MTQVLAEVEFKAFNPITGEKKSNAFNQYYTPQEWADLQKHGPARGLFVNQIIEAPEWIDTTYKNPGTK